MAGDDENYTGSVKQKVSKLFEELLEAIAPAIPAPPESDVAAFVVPLVLACSPSKNSDYQCNNALLICSKLNGDNALRLALAQEMMQNIPDSEIIESCSVGGNGYVNVVESDSWIAKTIKKMLVEGIETWTPRLEIENAVDFPSLNIAKELHDGHLRTCIIGDAIARLLEFSMKCFAAAMWVIWGTQFGMLLELIFEENPNCELSLHDLAALYTKANARFKEDSDFKERAQKSEFNGSDSDFKERAQKSVVRLQCGEVKFVKAWEKIREISSGACNELLRCLGVQSEEMGESFYGPYVLEVLEALSDQVKDDDEDGKRLRTRDSEVPRLVDLLDQAKNCSSGKVLELIKEKKSSDQWSEEELDETAEKLGCAAIKYSDLKNNISSNYKFSFNKKTNSVGNTALFLVKQYTRECST
ncbi:hypothetical protein LWI28_016202 [Acer negundo]|uniref:Uncharacterized protein n=1 Tax=Acer negundo TaxID=4023 RepID=A0AAD5NZA0_ACENE|nr:hypothetical protein LWI28_016202 [Acer negundo]